MTPAEEVLVLQNLLSKYVDENELNKLISNSLNPPYNVIKDLLKIKYDLIVQKSQQPVQFPVHSLLASDDFLTSNHHAEILKYALLIQKDNKELLLFEDFINTKINCSNATHDQVLNICNLLNVAFVLIQNHLAINIDNSENLRKFYKAVCAINSKQLMSPVNAITKNLASNVCVNTLLVCLKAVLASDNIEVLCCVIEYFLQCDSNSEICSLLIKYDIFEKISALISSYETINQRRGVFLLQQIKYYVINNDLFATPGSCYIKLPEFSTKDVETSWNAFFILSSICREKQIHLVKPALTFLDDLLCLHPLWVKTIYEIVFSHSQNEIVSHAVEKILTSKWYEKHENFLLLLKNLLETLSKIDYSRATIAGFAALGQYVEKCTDEVFWIILKESSEICWNPLNMWLFCKNVFKKDNLKELNIPIISKYVSYLQKLPHKFIRSGCIRLCLKFVGILSDFAVVSLENLFKLAMVVKETDVSLACFCDILQSSILGVKFELEDKIRKWKKPRRDSLYDFQIILHFIKVFDNPEDIFRRCNFLPFPNAHWVQILNNFEEMIQDTNSEIIFASLENTIFCCEKDVLDDAKCLLQKLSSRTAYCELHREEILNLCSLAKTTLKSVDSTNYSEREIAFEVLKHFDKDSLNIVNEIAFISVDHISAGALEILFKNASKDSITKLIELIEMIYERGSDKIVMAAIQHLPFLLTKAGNKNVICDILQISLNYILKLSRGEQFRRTLEAYLKIFISLTPLQNIIPNKYPEIIQLVWELSSKCSFIGYILTAHLKELVDCCPYTSLEYKQILVECLLSDACIRKEELSEYNVCKDIFETVDIHDDKDYISEQTLSRCLVFESILQLINNEQLPFDVRREFADDLAYILIKKYAVHLNKRYFKDSMVHIQKLRIIQALLLLQPYLTTSKVKIKNLMLESICNESHQHCVRQLIQWLLIRLLYENEEAINIFTSLLEDTTDLSNKKITTFTTSITILYHIVLSTVKEDRLSNAIDMLLPWTMGANFKLRVYAQVAILKLFEKAVSYNFVRLTEKHKNTHKCINSIILKGRDSLRCALQTDATMFFFFDPIKDYSLETILAHIPKINNVTFSEWEGCISVFESKAFHSIKVMNLSKEFEEYFEEAKKAREITGEKSKDSHNLDIIQRKITPWTEISQNKEQVKQLTNLVVIAVFVDKAANIGGLSRTCEIFGVQQLVVHDANITNDKEYKSLSMCSEGWLNITEVKQKDIKDYLINMKLEGYNIVAVEQTSNSVNLHKYTFQEKTVLILGNEKEGIPANVLPLADTCVEIPQIGVTRSLNVHVAGSLFIWEYSKTFLFK